MRRDDQQDESLQYIRGGQARQEETSQASNISKSGIRQLRKIDNRTSSISKILTHHDLMKDPWFRACFKLQQRASKWLYNCFKCTDAQSSFVSVLEEQQRKHLPSISEEERRRMKDRIIKLKIIESSRLQLDPNVMHPFVKIHIVDKNTGCYLKSNGSEQNIIYSKQQITYLDDHKKFETCAHSSLFPFATNCCDFRQEGDSRGVWNEKFFVNARAEDILNPNTVILFEILDFNHQALVYKDTDIYDKDNFFRVAWGYLRPIGIGKNHFGKTKLELFKYKYRNKKGEQMFNNIYVPSVYYDFIWNNHEKYEGFLSVQLILAQKPQFKLIDDDQVPKSIFEEHKKDKKYIDRFISAEDRRQQQGKTEMNEELLKFYRNRNHCEIPKQLIYKFESGKLGCFRVKFVGNYLYAACSYRNITSIKVFKLQDGEHVMTIKGHRGIVYSLTTNANPAEGKEKYLITGGSDHFVKIWKIPETFGQYYDEEESDQYLSGQLLHTAAVYSTSSILINLKDVMYTVTCCYDGYIRLWETYLPSNEKGARRQGYSQIVKSINVNTSERLSERVYPICSAVSQSNQIYIGESNGYIRIFNFDNGNLIFQNLVTHPDLSRDAILSIQIVERHMFVQSSDNMIRRYQLSGNKLHEDIKYAGGQYEALLLNAKISPDFKYLLAPSESGKPVLWDVLKGVTLDIDSLNLNIKGPLACCDWHPKYNLVVLGGFVEDCPIFVYGNVLTEAEVRIVTAY